MFKGGIIFCQQSRRNPKFIGHVLNVKGDQRAIFNAYWFTWLSIEENIVKPLKKTSIGLAFTKTDHVDFSSNSRGQKYKETANRNF